MKVRALWLILALLLPTFAIVQAQTATPGTPETEPMVVQVTASDGLVLVGNYYAQPVTEAGNPAVLLVHMIGSNSGAWAAFVPVLVEGGYAVLAIDQRGAGDTGGAQDWVLAGEDTTLWLDWLSQQDGVRDGALAIAGASIGANYALMTCANNAQCYTAIALSPGLDFRGVMPENALVEGLADRSALLVASYGDDYSAGSVKYLAGQTAQGEIGLRLYSGSAHGTEIFRASYGDRLSMLMRDWLDEHLNGE